MVIFLLDKLVNIQYVPGTVLPRVEQFKKLAVRVQQMIDVLAATKNLRLHANIDQFYYMQKLVELRLLVSILNTSRPDETLLRQKIHARCQSMYCTWKKDVRFLARYLRSEAHNLTPDPGMETGGEA